jgi:hypothetical protein
VELMNKRIEGLLVAHGGREFHVEQ